MKVRELLQQAQDDLNEALIDKRTAQIRERLMELTALERNLAIAKRQFESLLDEEIGDAVFNLE